MLATLLILLLCVGAGTIGGAFFAFSVFVMRALATIPPQQGIVAMQRINVVVINPLFLEYVRQWTLEPCSDCGGDCLLRMLGG